MSVSVMNVFGTITSNLII